MSGLAGIYAPRVILSPETTPDLLHAMARAMDYTHAGKIDTWEGPNVSLVRVHHGVVNPQVQPAFNEERSVCVMMDGELFVDDGERQRLVERGHQLRDESSAEYGLRLYEEDGLQALGTLNGSFALVLYDLRTRDLVLATDRMASHPLFWHFSGERLSFATSVEAVLQDTSVPRRLDPAAVADFFMLRRVLGERTYLEAVKALPPASTLRIAEGRPIVEPYWQPTDSDDRLSESEHVEALAEALEAAVRRRTRGAHRMGLLLSGGLDSRAVLAADREKRISVAYTASDWENREVAVARDVARVAGRQHVLLQRSRDHYVRLLDEAVAIGNGMHRFDTAHFTGLLDEVTPMTDVLLLAFGFDVYLKDLYHLHRRLPGLGRHAPLPWVKAPRETRLEEVLRRLPNTGICAAKRVARRDGPLDRAIDEEITATRERLRQALAVSPFAACGWLVSASLKERPSFLSVLSVRARMDERNLTCDNDLLDVALALPLSLRLSGRGIKAALQRLDPPLARLPKAETGVRADAGPWREWALAKTRGVLGRARLLPRAEIPDPTFTRGSWVDQSELIRRNADLQGMIWDAIHDSQTPIPDWFDVETLETLYSLHMQRNQDNATILLTLLTFGRWCRLTGI